MNRPLDNVWSLTKQFTESPKYVQISDLAIESWLPKLSEVNIEKEAWPKSIGSVQELIEYELIANSVNYCYWYGKPNIRPGTACAARMYELLSSSYCKSMQTTIASFKMSLSYNRFPLISERCRHLDELLREHGNYRQVANQILETKEIPACLELILFMYPGYAQDMFLKRASLFFMQVARKSDFFGDQINILPIPADYQIPKMLEHMGILIYSDELKNTINNCQLIPVSSLMECEIRASSIEACRRLSDRSGKNSSTVDYWLWLNRKSCDNNFHLTVTTDY